MAGFLLSSRFLKGMRFFTQKTIVLKKGPHDYPRLAGTEFWKRKMRTVFRARDIDGDGVLTKRDYELSVQRVSSYMNLDEDQTERIRKARMKLWEMHSGSAVDTENFKMSEDEYLSSLLHLFNIIPRDPFVEYSCVEFDSLDVDGDGVISPKEHMAFFYGLGIPTEHSPGTFEVLDTNGDGLITKEEFVQAGIDYALNEEENSAYNAFFGPLVA